MTQKLATLHFQTISAASSDQVAVITLDRPESYNAFNDAMIADITAHCEDIKNTNGVRAAILRAKGKHFCSGADLAWMKSAAALNYEENIQDSFKLMTMFESLDHLDVPIICLVQGSAFGGAVGLAAIADIVIAADNARFCLSEVKLGLLPAIILPYVARRMHPSAIRRFALSARAFDANVAQDVGLVDVVGALSEMDVLLKNELDLILGASSEAQAQLKSLYRQLRQNHFAQSEVTAQAIAKARTSNYGQAGLQSFFTKADPPWKINLSDDWTLR